MLKRPDSVDDFQRKQREKKITKPVEQKPVEPDKVESRAERTDRETYIKRGQEAWARHKADATWYDWLAIGDAISYGRTEAMAEAKTNEPKGRGYNQAFGTWLIEHGFDDFDASDRKRLFDVLEHRVEIEQWREKVLSGTERRKLNHPSTVWRKWKAYSETPQQKKEKAAKKQARIEAQEKQNEKQPATLKDAIHKIVDLEGQLEEVAQERDAARDAKDGYRLTLDQHIDNVVDLLEGEPAEVIKEKVTALVSRLPLTLAEIKTKPKAKSKKTKHAKK